MKEFTLPYSKKKGVLNSTPLTSSAGDSDFSIATVTIINNISENYYAYASWILDEQEMWPFIDSSDMTEDFPFSIVLYKGYASIIVPEDIYAVMEATGDIEIHSNRAIVSGDGTITIDTIG